VLFETTEGPFTVEVRAAWAPEGARRLWNLVRAGYFTDVAFFRVLPGKFAQFGIHGDREVSLVWRDARIADDPRVGSNARGTLVFGNAGPATRTTQLFVNLADNTHLDRMGFAPLGEVVEGMEVVDRLHGGYGESMPDGRGPVQRRIFQEGNAYLRAEYPELDYIVRAAIVE
jgi:peptidyl-prolyl cis-trans isomerase A (cyclophilin A)